MNLKESLEFYRSITLELIDKIKCEDDYSNLFEKRQNIIRNIETLSFLKDEFKQIATELDILNMEDLLKKTISEEKVKIKKKINYIKITREARVKYESAQFKPTFFNKTI
ncbi:MULTISPECIES: hypothetical protein [unclassified Clostridium]|uniref:hypothetical protein n=1 Tax=unclassified Clostridium TaxID=2614128 RepID=UPI000297D6B7|nr:MULTISPECIES: hypothetical protein [unclassified Clostridium]EKQ51137.1 MAG: hypothetical protein A370_05164 [Clostridium sp. Maddingley MBC34-26]